jgi:ABC-type proline/glycine betaine transport system permease subunit
MRAAVYLLHAVVGLGIGTVVGGLVWTDIVNQPTVVRAAPGALGVMLGLALAEWSRRKGTLLGRSKLT